MVEGEALITNSGGSHSHTAFGPYDQTGGREEGSNSFLRKLNSLSHFLLFDLEGCSVASERRSNVASGMRIEI
jgi:hypothetical protein